MTSMIERVARAIWTAREMTLPARTRMSWEDGSALARQVIMIQARAAIEAMREATKGMCAAAATALDADATTGLGMARSCWIDMIDAALEEGRK